MNPILKKELRTLLRERNGWAVPVIYAATLAVIVLLSGIPTLEHEAPAADTGKTFAGIVAVVQGIAILIFAPLVGASGIAGERERGTWTRLLATPIARRKIATGKLVAHATYATLLLVVSAPFGVLAFLLGGIDIGALFGLYLTHVVLAVTMVSVGLAMSTLFNRTRTAALVSIGAAAALCFITVAIYGALRATQYDVGADPHQWILYFNPGYGLFLFFGSGDLGMTRFHWWAHYAAMATITLAAVVLLFRKLGDLRE